MKDKARANLKASRTLVERSLFDPAMSRLYYALFQAGIHAMETQGWKPQDLSTAHKWNHDSICGNADRVRRRRDDLLLFKQAKGLRIQADYTPTPVDRRQVEALLPKVNALLEEVCP